MPQQDFQKALATFGRRAQELAAADPSFDEARLACHALIVGTGVQLTEATRLALVCLAGAMAVSCQDYAHDALAAFVLETPVEIWAKLPGTMQDLLNACWPDESGMTFLGKIGVAVVSEGFSYPN